MLGSAKSECVEYNAVTKSGSIFLKLSEKYESPPRPPHSRLNEILLLVHVAPVRRGGRALHERADFESSLKLLRAIFGGNPARGAVLIPEPIFNSDLFMKDMPMVKSGFLIPTLGRERR
jgi:hypothetical protein